MPRRRATVSNHAPGRSGTPSTGQRSNATTIASWNASSATSKSPNVRMSDASTCPDSSRNRRSRSLVIGWSTHPREGGARADLGAARPRAGDLRRQLEGSVEVLHVDDVVPAEDFLGLGEWAVGGRPLAVPHPHGRRRVGALERIAGHHLAAVDDGGGELHVLGGD